MRILITGSRNWNNRRMIFLALKQFNWTTAHTIVHGGAEGADTIAAEIASEKFGYTVEPAWRPDYQAYDPKVAPLKRNDAMLDSKPGIVLAFMLGSPEKGGTLYTVNGAKARGIPVVIYNFPGDPEYKR